MLNRPGAGGLIAALAAAGVDKDGYTLYMTQASTWTVLPIEHEGKMPINLRNAFVSIERIGRCRIAERRDRRAATDHVRRARWPCAGKSGRRDQGIRCCSAEALAQSPRPAAINETVQGVVSSGWIALMAPAGVPDAIIQRTNLDLRKVVALKEVRDQFHVLGTYTRDLTPAQTDDFIRSEEQLWWPIVRQVNEQK